MNDHLIRFAPLGSVLVLAAWCAWPYLSLPDGAAQLNQSNKLPRISRAMISPEFHAAMHRDPFVPFSPEPEVHEEAPVVASAPSQFIPAEVEPPPVDPLQALSGLKLNATSDFGARPMALINGALHEPGDRLTLDDGDFICTVRQIVHDKVVVEHEGELYELTYPAAFNLAAADYGKTGVSRIESGAKASPSIWEFIKHQLSNTN